MLDKDINYTRGVLQVVNMLLREKPSNKALKAEKEKLEKIINDLRRN